MKCFHTITKEKSRNVRGKNMLLETFWGYNLFNLTANDFICTIRVQIVRKCRKIPDNL